LQLKKGIMKKGTIGLFLFGAMICSVLATTIDYGDLTQNTGATFTFYNHSGKIVPLEISWTAINGASTAISGQDMVTVAAGANLSVSIHAKPDSHVTMNGWCVQASANASHASGDGFRLLGLGSVGYCIGDVNGGCYGCILNDDLDFPQCSIQCPTCPGMPTWSVSEPFISLWLHDEPLGYQPTIGARIAFELSFKQRESRAGLNPAIFSAGKKWNCSWLSYIDGATNLLFPGGGLRAVINKIDYVHNARLSGSQTTGFTLSYPDGSKEVYGFLATNSSGIFANAFLSERWNSHQQKTSLYYYTNNLPAVRLAYVVDGDGRTNRISYVTNNAFSTNLISQVTDAFGRTTSLAYDSAGRLTNIVDVQGIPSSFAYDGNGWVTNLTTPYGSTSFTITDTDPSYLDPQGRSILVTQPDGGHQLYLYSETANQVYSYPASPNTTPFFNTFDNTEMNARNSFYWGPMQYNNLHTTTISSFNTNDFLKARMKHWLNNGNTVGQTISMERGPSPDINGIIEGQKTWYDYANKTNTFTEGPQVSPLFVAQVLPDGTTKFTRSMRNDIGAVTNEISTYSVTSGSAVLLRTNIYVYDTAGIDLLATTNALGILVSSNIYNTSHEVLTNLDAVGQKTAYTYDVSSRIVTITSPTGLITTNTYGSDGFLAQQIVIGFSTNGFTYTNGLVYTQTDPRGLTVTNTWDNLQRLRRVDYPDGTFTTNTYQFLDLVRAVDRMGFTHSYVYDSMRRMTNASDALGHHTIYTYCTCGSLDSIQDAAGNVTSFNRDNLGRATNTVYVDGYSVKSQFNLLGQVTNTTDSSGASVTNWFSNQGLLVAVTNNFGRVQTVAYDILDRPATSVDVNGVAIDTAYDYLNRPVTRTYPDGGIERFFYTPNVHRMTTYTNQLLQGTLFGYDAAGRKIAETNANLEVTQFGYNGPGDLLTLTDGKNQTTIWNYDQFGRVTNKLDAASNVIFRYSYDADDRLTNRWTPVTSNTVYLYDAGGNLTTVRYQRTTNTFAYDAMNRLTNMVDLVGTTVYSYDAAGQMLGEDGPWSSDTVSYTYQNRLRMELSIPAPNASSWVESYSYDLARRLTNVTSSAGAFTYLLAGKGGASPLIKKLLLPNGATITNYYDGNARLLGTYLRSSSGDNLDSYDYVYNLGNQRTQQVLTAGNYVNYSYDNIGQLKTAFGKEPGGTTNRMQEQLGYFYDAAGNLNYRTNNTLLQQFNVNNLNELATVTNGGKLTVTGTTTSPATSLTVNSANATLYVDSTFASTNQSWVNGNNTYTAIANDNYGRQDTDIKTVTLTQSNNYAYDLNGNMLTNGTRVLEYDDENQLIAITEPNTWKSVFSYDGKMRRRTLTNYTWNGSSWLPTNAIHYIYDGNLVIQERDGNNLPQVTYTRGTDLSGSLQGAGGIGGLLARTANASTLLLQSSTFATALYHADGNGDITCLIYTNQIIAAKYKYDPFGDILSQSGPLAEANLYRFSSKEYHLASGLVYFLYRYFDPTLQRWLNRDPISERGGINLFKFALNDPVSTIDSFGQDSITLPKGTPPPPGYRLCGSSGNMLWWCKGDPKPSSWRPPTQPKPEKPSDENDPKTCWKDPSKELNCTVAKNSGCELALESCDACCMNRYAENGTAEILLACFNNCKAKADGCLLAMAPPTPPPPPITIQPQYPARPKLPPHPKPWP
jgi:RHS repeat-associated protein